MSSSHPSLPPHSKIDQLLSHTSSPPPSATTTLPFSSVTPPPSTAITLPTIRTVQPSDPVLQPPPRRSPSPCPPNPPTRSSLASCHLAELPHRAPSPQLQPSLASRTIADLPRRPPSPMIRRPISNISSIGAISSSESSMPSHVSTCSTIFLNVLQQCLPTICCKSPLNSLQNPLHDSSDSRIAIREDCDEVLARFDVLYEVGVVVAFIVTIFDPGGLMRDTWVVAKEVVSAIERYKVTHFLSNNIECSREVELSDLGSLQQVSCRAISSVVNFPILSSRTSLQVRPVEMIHNLFAGMIQ